MYTIGLSKLETFLCACNALACTIMMCWQVQLKQSYTSDNGHVKDIFQLFYNGENFELIYIYI